jgi:hypothetical protein
MLFYEVVVSVVEEPNVEAAYPLAVDTDLNSCMEYIYKVSSGAWEKRANGTAFG